MSEDLENEGNHGRRRSMPDNSEIVALVEALGVQIQSSAAATQQAIAALTVKVEALGHDGNAQAIEMGRITERLSVAQKDVEEAKHSATRAHERVDALKEKNDRWTGALSVLVFLLGLAELGLELYHRSGAK
jgi:pyruvate-formate lyase